MTTLLDIRKKMLDYMSGYSPTHNGEQYDEDGHCGDGLWIDIKNYWDNFKTDKDFLYVVSGEWADDIDLDGGRSYILSGSGIKPLLFDYMYNTLGYSEGQYDKIVYNSIQLTDELLDMFDDISVIRDTKIDSIISTDKEVFVPVSESFILKYPKEIKHICDSNSNLEFVGYSRLDNESPIYKIKVPSGGELVQSINKLIQ